MATKKKSVVSGQLSVAESPKPVVGDEDKAAVAYGAAAFNQKHLGAFVLPALDSAELAHIPEYFRPFAVPVDRLIRDPRNAREHDETDLPTTANSLKRFGQQHVIHYEPGTRIIKVGNGRHEAAQTILGWKWIAAVPNNLSTNELRAFALADNRTAEKSRWGEGLAIEMDALEELGVGIDDVGFSDVDLEELEEFGADAGDESNDSGGSGKGGGSGGGSGSGYAQRFAVIVDCRDEDHQGDLLERLRGEGLKVRAQTT